MRTRLIILVAFSAMMAWGGYQASLLKAGRKTPVSQVFAAAGGPSFFSGSDNPAEGDDYRISALSIFSNVALHVKDNYVDPDRISPKDMLVGALNQIEREIAEILVEDAGRGRLRVSVPEHSRLVIVDDVESLWEINLKLREVFRFFEKHLPRQKDMRAIEYAAVNGALATLDPHSVLLKPEAFAEMKTSTKGEFGGLGIVIAVREGKLMVISPIDGTPASKAGIKALDRITRIGDISTVSMPIEEAVRMLRGPEDSKVNIWIERDSWTKARKYTLIRKRIKIQSVESELLADAIGYIKIKNFQQNTADDLDTHISKLEKKAKRSLRGVVLDLRNNPGGLLDQAIRVSDKFLAAGDVVTTVGYGNRLREPKRADWSSTDLDVPLVVLVNNGSASASEIVAGALKNLDRAIIIGERTFGKGSVQVLYDFADNSALKLTIAQYLTPGNVSIQSVGISPDIALKPVWIDEDSTRLFYEPQGHREKNLDKHLERAAAPGVAAEAPVEAQPNLEVAYLRAPKDPADEPPEDDAFTADYPIELAQKLAHEVGLSSRKKALAKGKKLLMAERELQRSTIKTAIEKLSIDWSIGDASASALSVHLSVLPAASKAQISAGDDVTVLATVKNTGAHTLFQVRGEIETDNPAFSGRELLFGKVEVGATATAKLKTKIPREAASRSDILTLHVRSAHGAAEATAELPVTTEYVPHPQFAYSYSIDDQERGDGDGLLEAGEGVDMVVFLTNVGPGDAEKVSLRLRSAAGENLFLEKGRVELGKLPTKTTKAARLRFRVPKGTAAGERLPLELTVIDPGTGEWLEDELTIGTHENHQAVKTEHSGMVRAIEATPIYAAADPGAAVLALLPQDGIMETDGRVGAYLRVRLPEDSYGWLTATSVEAKAGATAQAPEFIPGRRPVEITIDGALGGRIVHGDSIALSGTIEGRQLRDMYIMLNEEKVFYRPGPRAATISAPGWARPNEQQVKMRFERDLPLEEGLNRILVVARLDDKVVTYRSLLISRVTTEAIAVAPETKPQTK